jgi:uncharacterized surface protein with fasciclin (FAS1) repeats
VLASSGNYFNSTIAALAFNPGWVTTYGYVKSTGVDKALASAKDPYTLFVPTNKAWKPIEPEVMEASTAAVADILKYHVVPGARQVGAAARADACTGEQLLVLLVVLYVVLVAVDAAQAAMVVA